MSEEDHFEWLQAARDGAPNAAAQGDRFMHDSLLAAREAKAAGDTLAHRYLLLAAGQAYTHNRISKLEQALNALVDWLDHEETTP